MGAHLLLGEIPCSDITDFIYDRFSFSRLVCYMMKFLQLSPICVLNVRFWSVICKVNKCHMPLSYSIFCVIKKLLGGISHTQYQIFGPRISTYTWEWVWTTIGYIHRLYVKYTWQYIVESSQIYYNHVCSSMGNTIIII